MNCYYQTMHQKVTGKAAYVAKETIRFCSEENDNTFTVEPGADVTVRAGGQIRLLPGFHAKAGSKFHAKIDPDIDYGTLLEPNTNESEPLATIEGYSHAGKVYDYSTGSYNPKNNNQLPDNKIAEPFYVNIYPNPTAKIINIEISGIDEGFARIEIYNTMGNLIRKEATENNGIFSINTSSFNQGIYYIRIIYKSAVISEKIIKL
jgi:hypothetical protein